MESIIRGLCDYGGTSVYWLLGFSFLLHIISLRKTIALVNRINIIENQRLSEQVDTMIGKIDSISKATRKLPERVLLLNLMFRSYHKVLIR